MLDTRHQVQVRCRRSQRSSQSESTIGVRFSLRIFRLSCFHFDILHFHHLFNPKICILNPKSSFHHPIKNFLSSIKDLEVFDQTIAFPHMSPSFINHFNFLNLKIIKINLQFNILTILPMDSTLTHHYC